jgi:protein O-GlcNAc transferase
MLTRVIRHLLASHAKRAAPDITDAMALLQQGRLEEAEHAFRQLVDAKPGDAELHHLLSYAQTRRRRFVEAVSTLERGLELAPDRADMYYSLGRAHIACRSFSAATKALYRALDLAPSWPAAWISVADALASLDDVDAAEDAFLRALELAPENVEAHYNYGNLLMRLGRIDKALQCYDRALKLKPDFHQAFNNLVYVRNFSDAYSPERIFEAHLEWARAFADHLTSAADSNQFRIAGGEKIRIGYVSANFREHAVTYFLQPVLEHHDQSTFDIYCYSDVQIPDARTKKLKKIVSNWRDTAGMSDTAVWQQIRRDGIHILVDLTGHTENDRLMVFARRAAPLQVTWNGYANTTGMSAIDYRITDSYADPPGLTEHLHSECLLRMPEIYMPFAVPQEDISEGSSPVTQHRYVTFGSFNALSKVTPKMIELWARILVRVPSARLVILTVPEGRTRARLLGRFSHFGVEPSRIVLKGRLSQREFMAAHHDVDIALDCFPFNGTTTTAHTLWMGVPVVTMAGRNHVSRVGVSMLSNAGLSQMVAQTEDEYVSIATALAGQTTTLLHLRQTTRNRMLEGPNMAGPRFTSFLEDAYKRIWSQFVKATAQTQ